MKIAKLISRCEKIDWQSNVKPVFAEAQEGYPILQESLRQSTGEIDAVVNDTKLRLPAGVVFCVSSFGSGGAGGALLTEVEFDSPWGRMQSTRGMQLRIPSEVE